MGFISAKQAADKWGISQRRVAVLCSEDRIANATMVLGFLLSISKKSFIAKYIIAISNGPRVPIATRKKIPNNEKNIGIILLCIIVRSKMLLIANIT